MDPGNSAIVLVALALRMGTPAKMRMGKVKKLPPPATELSALPNNEAKKRDIIGKRSRLRCNLYSN